MGKSRDILNLMSKKYSYKMLKGLEEGPKRFKDLSYACSGEKMRAQRLREFEDFKLLNVNLERMGRRAVSVYELSDAGRSILRLAEEIKKVNKKG